MTPSLSAIVTTFNSANVIEDCLKSLAWATEVLVVDSGSTDQTVQLASALGARVLEHPYVNPVAQKQWSIPQAQGEWILWVDSDERISSELCDEIRAVLSASPVHVGFKIPRLNYVFGKPVRYAGYYPDYQLRLFRRDAWSLDANIQVHERIELRGSCGVLTHPILHLAHRTVDQMTAVLLMRWTTFEAQERHSNGIRFSVWQMMGRTLASFVLRYIWYQGFRDGLRGLFVSGYWSMYLFMVYLKLWEIENNSPGEVPVRP